MTIIRNIPNLLKTLKSRSVACIVAYLLSKSIVETVDDGLSLIIEKNGSHNVNDGFMEQLELWERMGGKIDDSNGDYKKFKMKQVQESFMMDEGQQNIAKVVSSGPGYDFYFDEKFKVQKKFL